MTLKVVNTAETAITLFGQIRPMPTSFTYDIGLTLAIFALTEVD